MTSSAEDHSLLSNFHYIFDLYAFGVHMHKAYGMVNTLESMKLLFFHDIDQFNIASMLMNIVKIIVVKKD